MARAVRDGIELSFEHVGVDHVGEAFTVRENLARALPRLRRIDLVWERDPQRIAGLFAAGVGTVGIERDLDFVPVAHALLAGAGEGHSLVVGLRGSWHTDEEDWSPWAVTLTGSKALAVSAVLHGPGRGDDLVAVLAGLPVEKLTVARAGRSKAGAAERARLEGVIGDALSIGADLRAF